jgi:hypothetical protein
MKKLSLTVFLWLFAGLLWLVAAAVVQSGARWMAIFCALVFLSVGIWRMLKSANTRR